MASYTVLQSQYSGSLNASRECIKSWKASFININGIANITWNLFQEVQTAMVNVLSFQEYKTKLMGQREPFYPTIAKVVWRFSQRYWLDGFII